MNPWQKSLEFVSISDIGLQRTNNQDSHQEVPAPTQKIWNRRGHIFVVADGMGAHAAGELASKLATDLIPNAYMKKTTLTPGDSLREAIQEANRMIHTKGNADEELRGMGTTCDALVLLPEGALIGHVGDSRVYRLRNSRWEQLTFDHSVVWEMQAQGLVPDANVQKNIITRGLGVIPEVEIDLEGPWPCQPGDIFLLCSDGLSGQFEDREAEMGKILSILPLREATQAMVDIANLRGGPDNITVTTVKYLGPQQAVGKYAEENPVPVATRTQLDAMPLPNWVWNIVVAAGVVFLLSLPLTFQQYGCGLPMLLVSSLLLMAFFLYLHLRKAPPAFTNHRLGRGPYRQYDARCDVPFLKTIQSLYAELRESVREQSSLRWSEIDAHEKRAKKACSEKRLVEATREYLLAISSIWRQLSGNEK
ncbi:MAG: protein phosphatase 2C domain-containing protein [Planctomycetia bacterium]|nr:protein phosphatase 2C domain-containing protein [Planctomycetia bacterium]